MKRCGGLWQRLVAWDDLVLAARKAQRGKRNRASIVSFNFDQERQLLRLQHELNVGQYRPGAFRVRWITHPKPRLISAAPYRDRVVHHALMNVLEPVLDRRFHPDSYACRKGKGTLAASRRLQVFMARCRYAVHCDVRKFFPSIDHEILKGTFRRLIKDSSLLSLMDLIVDSSNPQPAEPEWFEEDDLFSPAERRRGLPIGNLTSQWFANWMLNDLDHCVTSRLGFGAYLRYCDDFVLLHDEPHVLQAAIADIRRFLASRRLRIHEARACVRAVERGLTFVGFRTWATHRLIRKDNVRRFRRRLRGMKAACARGSIDWRYIKPRLVSWIAHARNAHSERLIRRLSREWTFAGGKAEQASCDSRRHVEQQCHELPVYEPQQQHAVQSEQQHRIPLGPALSAGVLRRPAPNRMFHGSCECGEESPGLVPVPAAFDEWGAGQICSRGTHGTGRRTADGRVRLQLSRMLRAAT